jgi:tetratricopeptide (TPR) repeat protein
LINKAIAANPTDVTPHLELIAYYLRGKEMKKAVAAGQNAQAAIPDRPEILEALAKAQLAAGDPNQAIATYAKWSRLQPLSALPWVHMAEAQLAAKDTNGALQSLRKALEIQPDSVDAQRGIMTLDLAANRVPEALAIARESPEAAAQGSDRLPPGGRCPRRERGLAESHCRLSCRPEAEPEYGPRGAAVRRACSKQ